MKKYFNIYWLIFSTSTKRLLEYRINALVHAMYAITYMILLNLIIQIIFQHTHTLGGWTKDEVMMLYVVVATLFNTMMFLCLEGFRKFMNYGVRNGEIDQLLTKPIHPLFGVSLFMPDITIILPTFGMIGYGIFIFLKVDITLLNFIIFLINFILSLYISYLIFSLYASVAFFVDKAGQVMELITKSSDYSQYPMSIFPRPFQLISFSVLPIAFFGYVSTTFLLGKGSWQLMAYTFIFCIFLYYCVKKAWQIGLKKYSSASS